MQKSASTLKKMFEKGEGFVGVWRSLVIQEGMKIKQLAAAYFTFVASLCIEWQ